MTNEIMVGDTKLIFHSVEEEAAVGKAMQKPTRRPEADDGEPISKIDEMLTELLRREGGAKFTHDVEGGDPPTKYGITLPTLKTINSKATVDDLKKMKEAEALEIYKDRYFNKPKISDMKDSKLRENVFDFGVNAGTNRSIKLLQRVLDVEEDGVLGPKTLEAVNKADADKLNEAFKKERIRFYQNLVKKDKRKKKYLKGWLNRANEF